MTVEVRTEANATPFTETSAPATAHRVLIVGNPAQEHVGAHLLTGAHDASIAAAIANSTQAWTGGRWRQRIYFRLLGRRPTALGGFSRGVVQRCREFRPTLLLTTGIAPLSAQALRRIGQMGVRRINYQSDDPWSPAKRARFFWSALREYDTIYSPRHASMDDLRAHGCADVRYLPFAYSPHLHFFEAPANDAERDRFACDICFVGGADAGRAALMSELLRAGLRLNLYGGYWDRFPATRPHHRGFAIGREMRLAVAGGVVNVCMGRASNRDGHAMRTFELPAMRACMLVEDTSEHRAIFGPDGECVYYYRDAADVIQRTRELIKDPERERQLGQAVHDKICNGQHTYQARLLTMLENHAP